MIMPESAEEKAAREKKERMEELRNDPRHGDLRLMMEDIFVTNIIPEFGKDRPNEPGPAQNVFDKLFGE